jgi:hypothetical protein
VKNELARGLVVSGGRFDTAQERGVTELGHRKAAQHARRFNVVLSVRNQSAIHRDLTRVKAVHERLVPST